jgi:hypothetical protein
MTKALRQRAIKTPGPRDRLRCYALVDIAVPQFERLSEVRREHLGRQGPVPPGGAHPEAGAREYLSGDGAVASLTASEPG